MKPWQEIMSLKSTKGLILIVDGLLFLGLPLFASQYVSYLMLTFFAYATMVLGLNLLFGYPGLLSFGHAFFMAIGAYTASVITVSMHLGKGNAMTPIFFFLALLCGGLMAAVFGLLVGAAWNPLHERAVPSEHPVDLPKPLR